MSVSEETLKDMVEGLALPLPVGADKIDAMANAVKALEKRYRLIKLCGNALTPEIRCVKEYHPTGSHTATINGNALTWNFGATR